MNNELFDRVMSAVDDDLLEEAQYPARAKRPSLAPWIALVVGAAACLAVIVTARAQTRAPGYPESSLAVNPLQTVNVLAVEELGYRLPLPEDAQKPSYFLIDPGKPQAAPVAEVRFERNGATYTCRTQKTAAATDISGLYIEWSQSYTWSSDTLEVTVAEAEDLTTCVSWYEETTGTQWCLSGDRNGPELAHTAGSIMNTLGFDLGVVPAGATDISFGVLTQDGLTVGETTFVLNGTSFAYRVAATNAVDEDFADISGIETVFAREAVGRLGRCRARLAFDPEAGGKVVWFDPVPGLLYSLYMDDGASEEALLNMSNLLFKPAQNGVG